MLALLVGLGCLTACGSDPVEPDGSASVGPDDASASNQPPSTGAPNARIDPTTTPGAPAVPTTPATPRPVPPDVASSLQALLDERAAAVLTHDEGRFRRVLTPGGELANTESGYFANVTQLPLSAFSYRLLPESLVRLDDDYWGVVELTTMLGAFDRAPVRTLDRFRFSPARSGFTISTTTDAEWEREHLGRPEPWDVDDAGQVRDLTVVSAPGVLGVFDAGTVPLGPRTARIASAALADIASRVPYAWPRAAAFYALSDPGYLDGFDRLPGGDPQALDALAFAVPSGPEDATVASERFTLSPAATGLLDQRRPGDLARLVRHELAHVALGTHDDAAPVWLREGVAEWLSMQAVPVRRWGVPAEVVAGAGDRRITMPTDASFNDADAAAHYALGWWVCEWIVRERGEGTLWALLDGFAGAAQDPSGETAVLRRHLGLTVDQLARRGAALMVREIAKPSTPRLAG